MTEPWADVRADRALREAFEAGEGDCEPELLDRSISRTQVQTLIESGHVVADEKTFRSSVRLRAGQKIAARFPLPSRSTEVVPRDQKLEVPYEDAALAIVVKPQGLTTHPAPTESSETLVHGLLHRFPELSQVGGPLRPGIVHRLDKYTSGLLIVAKTDRAHHALIRLFQERKIEKHYEALVYGVPKGSPPKESPIDLETFYGRNPNDRKKMAVLSSGTKKARSRIHVRKFFANNVASHVDVQIFTGRTHQIRVHLAHLKTPILGDTLYGPGTTDPRRKRLSTLAATFSGQALHACRLAFDHPITEQRVDVTVAPPSIFQNALATLERYGSAP